MAQQSYRMLNHSFSMALENDWFDESVYRIAGPEFDGLAHHITVTVDSSSPSVDVQEYVTTYLQALQSSLDGFVLKTMVEVKMFNSQLACELVYQWVPQGCERIIQRCIFTKKDQQTYILMTTFTPLSWIKLHKTIDNMMRSFH